MAYIVYSDMDASIETINDSYLRRRPCNLSTICSYVGVDIAYQLHIVKEASL
jgi:hypothetical protein